MGCAARAIRFLPATCGFVDQVNHSPQSQSFKFLSLDDPDIFWPIIDSKQPAQYASPKKTKWKISERDRR